MIFVPTELCSVERVIDHDTGVFSIIRSTERSSAGGESRLFGGK